MAERCQIWLRRAPAVTDRGDFRLLDEPERLLNQHFVTESLRARHACAHALLRRALAQSLDREPSEFRFEPGFNDRPALHDSPEGFDFNLSHGGPYVACAVFASGRVGIDVEAVNPKMDFVPLLGHTASPAERAWLGSMPPDQARHAFFRLWVVKEAYAKSRGDGLSLPFSDITLMPLEDTGVHDLEAVGDDPEDWSISLFEVDRDAAALAVAVNPARGSDEEVDIEVVEGAALLGKPGHTRDLAQA